MSSSTNGKVETGANSKGSTSPTKIQTSPGKDRTALVKNNSPEKGRTSPTKNQSSQPKASSPTKVTSPTKATSPTKNDDSRKGPEGTKQKTETKPKNGATSRDKSQGPKAAKSNGPVKEPSAAFKEKFQLFSKFGDTKSDGKLITLSQSDKWMKQAKVVDGKKLTTTDTAIHFKKFKAMKISVKDYTQFIDDLAKTKGIDADEIRDKLAACGPPAVGGAGAENKKVEATVNRLTDVSKYTGSHKQRFDEAGKGKGIAGRKDLKDGSGYVQGYQNKNTYSKTH